MSNPEPIDDSFGAPITPPPITSPRPGLPPPSQELRSGALCPRCHLGRLDYNGLLELACPECGYTLAGCFT